MSARYKEGVGQTRTFLLSSVTMQGRDLGVVVVGEGRQGQREL